jgi:hypothetical protein
MDRWDHPLYLKWLSDLPVEAADEVVSAMNYLTEFGRSAQLDLARHRIQTSKHFPHMSEVRVRYRASPDDFILRVLTVFAENDSVLVVCFAGDKARWARDQQTDWYETAVPIADQVFDRYLLMKGTK